MVTAPVRVLHLVGSAVDAFHAELSRVYARDCLTAIDDPDRYVSRIAFVAPDGSWRFASELREAALDAAPRHGRAGRCPDP